MKTTKSVLIILALLIAVIAKSQNCTVNAGIDQTVCTSSVTLVGAQPENRATTWSQILGPTATITSVSSKTTTVTGLVGGNTYKFLLSSVCSDGLTAKDSVTIIAQSFPVANAGNALTICTGVDAASLNATAVQGDESGVWTFVSTGTSATTGGLSIKYPTDPKSPLTLVTGTSNSGNVTLRWTVTKTGSGCTAYSDVVVTKIAVNTNFSAGADKTINNCYTSTATSGTMSGTYSGGGTYGRWTAVSGPNTPVFNSPNSHITTVSNLIQGTYIIRWTVTTPCFSGSDDVTLIVNPQGAAISQATAVIVGNATNSTYCDNPGSLSLAGSAYNAATETVLWTKESGAGTITSPNSRYTTVTGLNGSSSQFKYTITNSTTGCSSASANLTITFEAGQTLAITTPSPVVLACNTITTTINIAQTGLTQPKWVMVSYPTGYTPRSEATLSTSATSFNLTNLSKSGTYLVRIKKTVGNCTTIYDDIEVIVSNSPTASNAGSDPVLPCNATSATLIGNTVTAPNTGKWTQLSGPNTATITAATNAQTNVTGLTSGLYEFRWTISNGAACPTTRDEVRVRIASTNPTTSKAGKDSTVCNTAPLRLYGNAIAATETGTWTVSPSAGVTFSNRNSPSSFVTGLAANTAYTFTWTIANSCSTSADNTIITTSELLGPIAALAGSDQCLSSGTTNITLTGNSTSGGNGLWTKLSGPAANIQTPTASTTLVDGLSDGIYTFVWTIARNACTSSSDTVVVTISAAATLADAGPDQLKICGSSATLSANSPTIGSGVWTQVSGPSIAIITTPSSNTSTVTGMLEGQYVYRWTISNGSCSANSDDVIIYASNPPTAPNAGIDITVCSGVSTMSANTIDSGVGFWNVISGPNAPVIANSLSPTTGVSNLIAGTYILTWNSRTLCSTLSNEVIINVIPVATAGTAQTLCGTTATTLTGNVNTAGVWTQTIPIQSSEVITQGAGGNTAVVSNLSPGTNYTFKYALVGGGTCGASEATVTVNVLENPSAAVAGPDQNTCITNATTSIVMAATAPTTGTGKWTKTSGTGTISITEESKPNATITAVSPGISVFTWTTTNGTCTFADQMVVNVSRIVTRSAGDDQTICGTTATMAAEAPASGVGTWWQLSGPNSASFASKISNASLVTGLQNGTYVFRWSIKDGSCDSIYDDMTLYVNTAPTTPLAGDDQTLCNASTTTLAGNEIITGQGTWTKVSGPTYTISNINDRNATLTNLLPGNYIFRWTSSNGSCIELTDELTIINNDPPTTAAAGSDIRVCLYAPFNLAANTPSVGTGAWSQVSGTSTVNFTNPALPTTTITGAVAGSYTFRWTISSANCTATTDDVNLIVDAIVTEPNAGDDISSSATFATMAANAITSGSGVWSKISGPIGASITNVNSPTTTITGLIQGTYVYRWTATNGTCTSYDEVIINNSDLQTYNINPNPTFTTCTISWSNGSKTSRVVFMKEGTGSITNPVNSTTYSPSVNWLNKGTQVGGTGYYCIYSGTGSSVYLTGLYPGRTYTVRAFEYDGNSGSEVYLTNLTGTQNPTTFVPWPTTTFTNSLGVTSEQDWNTSARWDHDTIPAITRLHEAVLVYIDGNCIVNNDENSYNLTIKAAHGAVTPKLTIAAGSSLNITGGALGGQFINSGGVNALLVKASATQPTGTLTWKTGDPTGSVEMYSKASWDLSKPVNNKYKWQFMGIPVKSTIYNTTFSSCYLREWDETVTLYDDVWARRNDGTSLQKGSGSTLTNNKGYELVQQYPKIYTFKGTLQHDDFVQSLSYTPTAYFKGQHVFGNPFTAAIDIRSIEFGANTEHTVYQYNCGTYTDWIDNHGENIGIDGTELTPARYAVATKQTAGVLGILRQVPSMQGFLVKATNAAGGSITITYPTVMKNSIHQRAKQELNADVVATRIDVKGTNFSDKMWIFVDPACTPGFDNGWDGVKLPGDESVTQIYGIESDGAEYQINAVNDINESVIGFKPGNDKDFTIKFTHENIQKLYSKLYLVDMPENKTIDVTADGSFYTFSAKSGDPIKRFKISTATTGVERVDFDNNIDVFVRQNVVYINNRNSTNAQIGLYDEIGRCITNTNSLPNSQINIPIALAKGVYIIKIRIDTTNFSKRIIMN